MPVGSYSIGSGDSRNAHFYPKSDGVAFDADNFIAALNTEINNKREEHKKAKLKLFTHFDEKEKFVNSLVHYIRRYAEADSEDKVKHRLGLEQQLEEGRWKFYGWGSGSGLTRLLDRWRSRLPTSSATFELKPKSEFKEERKEAPTVRSKGVS